VADFRDPWSDYFLARWDPLSRLAINAVSRRLLRHAGVITAASEGIAASIARGVRKRVHCVRNGFDRSLPIQGVPASRRELGYFGRVDPRDQHPERLWPALRLLRERGRPCGIRFHLTAGGGGGGSVAVPPDLTDLATVLDPVSHVDAQGLMSRCLGLVVLSLESRGGAGIVPGKLYEYAGSGRPSLVIAPETYEARQLAERLQIGLGAWTPPEVASSIDALGDYTVSEAGRSCLSRVSTAGEMMGFLESARRLAVQQPLSGVTTKATPS
jgi:hypothetical protein